MLTALARDISHAGRLLTRAPGYAAVIVLTLGLGIGANTAIFSLVEAVLLDPLPYPDSDRLAMVWETRREAGDNIMYAAPPNYLDWRDRAESFHSMMAFDPQEFFYFSDAGTRPLRGAHVTPGFFSVLGAVPALGRTFLDGEIGAGADVAVISHGFWSREFGADPDIIDRTVRLGSGSYRVVGVMPEGFDFGPYIGLEGDVVPRAVELWLPFPYPLSSRSRSAHYITVVGRLAPGVSVDRADDEIGRLADALSEEYPAANEEWSATVEPFERAMVGDVRTALWVLLAAVGALLLVAAVNVANLMLARAAQRYREFAVRAALGAGRRDLLRQSLVESQVLALAGAAVGVLLAYASLGVLVRIAPAGIPRLDAVGIDVSVLAFAVGLAVLTGLGFGLLPALAAGSGNVGHALRQRGRTAGKKGARTREALVVAQVALSLALLVAGGLLFQSFLTLRGVDPGVESDGVVTARISLPDAGYTDASQITATYQELEARIAALPEIDGAGFTAEVPLASNFQGTTLRLADLTAPPGERWLVNFTSVSPGFFDVMGLPLEAGRFFDGRDTEDAVHTAVVNRAVVEQYLDGREGLGQRVVWDTLLTVVGVVGSVRHEQLDADPTPAFYMPLAQQPRRDAYVVAGYSGSPAGAVSAIRDVVAAVDPSIPVYDVRTMADILADRLSEPRFSGTLVLVFSLLALFLAGVGLYGVVSYNVNRRTREIGIRIALGSAPAQASRLVMRQSLRMVGLGVAIGLLLAGSAAVYIQRLLYQPEAMDMILVGAGVSAFLVVVAMGASYGPARRAAGVQPVEALREE